MDHLYSLIREVKLFFFLTPIRCKTIYAVVRIKKIAIIIHNAQNYHANKVRTSFKIIPNNTNRHIRDVTARKNYQYTTNRLS